MADTSLFEVEWIPTQHNRLVGPVAGGTVGLAPGAGGKFVSPAPYQGSPPSIHVVVSPSGQLDLDDLEFFKVGPLVGEPSEHTSAALAGVTGLVCDGYEADLYERIHVIPSTLALGNVLTDQIASIEVWNAFSTDQTLAQISESGTGGIVISGQPDPPLLYARLSSRLYSLAISTLGPADINAEYEFDFTIQAAVLTITGTRVVSLTNQPLSDMEEGIEFKTQIIEAYDGTEQRIAVRDLPRQQFNMNYLISDQIERSSFLNKIAGHHGRTFAVPMFQFARPLLQAASAGNQVIFVNTVDSDFRDSSLTVVSVVVLWRAWDDFEIGQVSIGGIAAGQITLERDLSQDHSVGPTFVIPMQFCISQNPIEWSRTANSVTSAKIGWLSRDNTEIGDLSSLPLHEGLPVLAGLNFIDGNSLSESINIKYDLFDNGTGVFEPIFGRVAPELASVKGFETHTEADSFLMRKIVYGMRGKQKAFFMPSFRDDFNLITTVGSSDVGLDVTPVDYTSFLNTQEPWGSIMIQLLDGTRFFRSIVGSSTGVGLETLVIDTALGQVVNPSDVEFICYLHRMRFNVDKIKILHHRIGDLTVRIPVVGVIS